jgi:hypothetical protein
MLMSMRLWPPCFTARLQATIHGCECKNFKFMRLEHPVASKEFSFVDASGVVIGLANHPSFTELTIEKLEQQPDIS